MKVFVESWRSAEKDHCWLAESSSKDYVDDPVCYGCGSPMEVISEIINSNGRRGLITGFCPYCGYTKRIRNLPEDWYTEHFSKDWLKNRTNESVTEDRYLYELLTPFLRGKGRVLDIGCGIGSKLIPFKRAGFDVYGVEPSEKRSSTAAEILGNNIETATGERYLANCPYSFDLIYLFNVIQFTKNPFNLLSMAVEKLDDSGIICIRAGLFSSHLDEKFGFCQFSHFGVLRSFLSVHSLNKLFSDLNLTVLYYTKKPFVVVLRKGWPVMDEKPISILKGAKKITRTDVERYVKKTLKLNRPRILRKQGKQKLNFHRREIMVKIEESFDNKCLPVSFIYDTTTVPILLK